MLYDVLPPLFLLASFGGIIIVVSRVMIRIRRDTVTSQMHASAATAPRAVSEQAILHPGKKGIKLVGSRLALIPVALKSTAARTREAVASRKQTRAAKKSARIKTKELLWQERQKAKQAEQSAKPTMRIEPPTQGWRDKLSTIAARGKGKASALTGALSRQTAPLKTAGNPADQPEPAVSRLEAVRQSMRSALPKKEPHLEADKKSLKTTIVTAPQIAPERGITPEQMTKPRREKLLQKVRRRPKQPLASPLEHAQLALAAADYGKVESILIPYIMKHPRDADAYMILGNAAMQQENWDEALETFEQVKKIHADHEGLKASLGKSALNCGKMTLALQTLQRAHDEDPENTDVLQNLITIAQRMDNPTLKKSAQQQLTQIQKKQSAGEPVEHQPA